MSLVNNKYTIEELEEYIANNELNSTDWYTISKYQKLTETFIEKYKDKVVWKSISKYQKLTEPFIDKHSDRVDWYSILKYKKVSYELLERHLYYYTLYQKNISNFINSEHLVKLQDVYKDKYYIDKLAYELNR